MTAGSVTQQVTVNADTVQLTTTDNGTIASTLENQRINQLPMNGRNILQLAAETTPGLGSCNQDSNGQCANGLMGYGMEYVADGVTLEGREFGGGHVGQAQFPDPDSIQEMRVETTGTERAIRHAGNRRHHHQVRHQQPARLALLDHAQQLLWRGKAETKSLQPM